MNGKEAVEHPKKLARLEASVLTKLIGTMKLLEKLILSPEASEKASKRTLIISADLMFPSKKRRLSAN